MGLGVNYIPSYGLRTFQHTPIWEHTPDSKNQQFMIPKSVHLRVKGDVWGILQAYVGVHLDMGNGWVTL